MAFEADRFFAVCFTGRAGFFFATFPFALFAIAISLPPWNGPAARPAATRPIIGPPAIRRKGKEDEMTEGRIDTAERGS